MVGGYVAIIIIIIAKCARSIFDGPNSPLEGWAVRASAHHLFLIVP